MLQIQPAGLDQVCLVSPTFLQGFVHDPVACMRTMRDEHGNLVAFARGPQVALFAFGPEYNRHLLSNSAVFHLIDRIPGPKNSAHRRLGSGLFNMNGARHDAQRRLLIPLFRKEAVDGYVDVLTTLAKEMLDGWRVGQTRDMAREMKQFALRITSNILFGLEDRPLAEAIEVAFEDWLELNHQVSFVGSLPIDIAAGSYDEMLAKAERLEQVLGELVRHKRSGQRDTLALLLHACADGHITQQEVVGQATHLFNAAYHTTTYALTWSLFLLSQHPAEMARVLDELETVLEGDVPTADELPRLTYLDWAIRESLRLLPPVIYYPRVCVEPVKLGNFSMPRGTLVVGSHYITHHMEEVFPEPERFNPERWRTWSPSPYAYIPFGAGPRMCLGAPFALLVLKQTLAMIFREFRLSVVAGARIDRHCSLTLGLRDGLPMRIWKQDGRFSTSPVVGDIHEMVELPDVHAPVEAAVA